MTYFFATLPGVCFVASLPSQRQLNFRVIASVSVAIPLKKYAVNTPYFTPRVDSPDETGEVAHISVPKGGRAVEPAAVATLLCNDIKFSGFNTRLMTNKKIAPDAGTRRGRSPFKFFT